MLHFDEWVKEVWRHLGHKKDDAETLMYLSELHNAHTSAASAAQNLKAGGKCLRI